MPVMATADTCVTRSTAGVPEILLFLLPSCMSSHATSFAAVMPAKAGISREKLMI